MGWLAFPSASRRRLLAVEEKQSRTGGMFVQPFPGAKQVTAAGITQQLSRRLIFVSGKGGVGKSTVAAVLGVLSSRARKRTLLVELSGQCAMASLLGGPVAGYEELERRPHLFTLSMTPQAAMEEYLIRELHSRKLYELTFKNRYVAPFVAAVPGLEDLMCLGKIMDLERSVFPDGRPQWDLIIVDAPSTGQGINLLRVPKAMMEMTQAGPFYRNTKLIHDLLIDSDRCLLNLVTLPEEMPVNETIEVYRHVKDEMTVALGHLLVNQVRLRRFDDQATSALTALWEGEISRPDYRKAFAVVLGSALEVAHRISEQQAYVKRLRESVDMPCVELPSLALRNLGPTDIDDLADHLLALERTTGGEV